MADLLIAQGVRKEFGGLVAVNDVDFTIPERTIVSLIGPNGAGKTTFFNMLTGVLQADRGPDRLRRPRRHGQAAARDHRARHRAHVPEHPALPEHDLARERARRHALAAEGRRPAAVIKPPSLKREEIAARAKAHDLLEFCGLRGRDDEYARNLAYGDQRRLEVARALATEPKLLLLDEPTAGMNPQETAEFTAFVGKLRERRGPDRPHDRARHAGRDGRSPSA